MNQFLFNLLLCCLVLAGCSGVSYHSAPPQNLPQVFGPSASITILNTSGGNVEFFEGPLEGLILAPWESYQADLPLGYQTHVWSQEVLHKNKIINYTDRIIVTHRSKTLRVVPPPRDDLFYTRGSGRLDLREY